MRKQIRFIKIFFLCTFALFTGKTFCQNIDVPEDSIKTILCKQWEVDYAMIGNTKTSRLPGATEINFAFFPDGSFVMTSDNPTETTKGTWRYIRKTKSVTITTTRRRLGEIVILNQREFTMEMETNESNAGEAMIRLMYKPKTSTSAPKEKKTNRPGSVQIKNLSFSDPNSSTIYVGKENRIEIEGVQGTFSFSVTGAGTTMKKATSTKVILLPSKVGTAVFTVTQNGKVIAIEKFNAIVTK